MKRQTEKFLEKYGHLPQVVGDLSALAPRYEDKRNQFKEFYADNYTLLQAAEKTLRNLIQLLLHDLSIAEPKITSRIKDRDGCLGKFEVKYRDNVERLGKDYSINTYITDLIGIRVVCLYESDIDLVGKLIEEQFNVIGVTDKTLALNQDVRSFGYKGLHLDIMLKDERAKYTEYKNFSGLRFEIQVRSIVQDAWSEIDHKLKYKRQTPDGLQRRIFRLAALFELADQEFMAIRNETEKLEIAAISASNPDSESVNRDLTLDAFSFLSVMQLTYPSYTFDSIRVDGFVDEVIGAKPDMTISELVSAQQDGKDLVRKYKNHLHNESYSLNPFTETRFQLYVHDPDVFERMLYPRQRQEFLRWFNDKFPQKSQS